MRTRAIAALAALLAAASAHAVPVTNGGFTYEFLDFSGKPSNSLTPNPGCGSVGSGGNVDYRCDPMTFNGGVGGLLTVTSPGTNSTVFENLDKHDAQYGLGVVSGPTASANPWVDPGEVLTLSFANLVNLVGYHIYQVGNAPGHPDQFQVSVDGGAWQARSFASLVYTSDDGRWLTGHTFSFKSADYEKFYVGAVKITSAVPEPETYALMLAGLGALAVTTRRRRRNNQE